MAISINIALMRPAYLVFHRLSRRISVGNSSLWLTPDCCNLVLKQVQGVPKDPRCDGIENKQFYIGLLTALFSSVVIGVISKLHNKEVAQRARCVRE